MKDVQNKHSRLVFAVILFILFSFLFTIPKASAAINSQINYQGKLTDSSGVDVTNGNYIMKFRLYTSATGATTTNIWEEIRTATGDRAVVTGGLFSVMLGSSTALTGVDFNQTLYLGVEVCGTSGLSGCDGEMSPRKILGAVPAAFEAQKLSGLATSSFLRSDATNSTTTASTFVTINQAGTGNILDLQDGGTVVFTVRDGGNIGIGTTSPYAKLSVVGETVSTYFTATSTTATSSFAGGLTVDANTLVVDFSNNRVGIGTTSPWGVLSVASAVSGGVIPAFVVDDSGTTEIDLSLGFGGGNPKFNVGTSSNNATLHVAGSNGVFNRTFYVTTQTGTSALLINNIGEVGIGTSSANDASATFSIHNRIDSNDAIFYLNDTIVSGTADLVQMYDEGTPRFFVDSGGDVGIATSSPWRTLAVNGTVGFAGLTTNTGGVTAALCLDSNNEVTRNTDNETCVASSRRYKKNIEILDPAFSLETLAGLRPVSFEFKIDPGATHYGFIAEEVESINERLVSYDSDGLPQSVRYIEIIPLLTQAIQELSQSLRNLTGQTLVYIKGTFDSLIAKEVKTDKLCVGVTCVTEDEFLAMVQKVGVSSLPDLEPDPEPVATSTDPELELESDPEPDPEPTPELEPVTESDPEPELPPAEPEPTA